jgi:hypothetical protein
VALGTLFRFLTYRRFVFGGPSGPEHAGAPHREPEPKPPVSSIT